MTKSELEPYLNSLFSKHSIALLFHTANGTYIANEVNFSDGDTVVFKVEQVGGAACHTGHRSCFFRKVDSGALVEIAPVLFDPVKVYKK